MQEVVDDASHIPHLRAALALIAHRQGAISDQHLRQLLRHPPAAAEAAA